MNQQQRHPATTTTPKLDPKMPDSREPDETNGRVAAGAETQTGTGVAVPIQQQQNVGTKPPPLTEKDIVEMVKKFFDLNVKRIRELNSYDDRNYQVFTEPANTTYVLKLTNSDESRWPLLMESQNEMIEFLHRKGFNVPCPVPGVVDDGQTVYRLALPLDNPVDPEKLFAIRLFHFVPGQLLFHCPLDENLLADCGHYLARLDLALETFDNETIRHRKAFWALANVPQLHEYIHYIGDPDRQEMVRKCVVDFEEKILTRLDSLKHGYLHGDFNEQNIIVRQADDDDGSYQVHGIIDFGDIAYGPQIYDLAIFLAYVMLLKSDRFDSVRDGPRFVLQGYRRLIPVNKTDLELILICAKARLCQSLTLGAYTYSLQPENDYLLTTAKIGWHVLERLCWPRGPTITTRSDIDQQQHQLIAEWMDKQS